MHSGGFLEHRKVYNMLHPSKSKRRECKQVHQCWCVLAIILYFSFMRNRSGGQMEHFTLSDLTAVIWPNEASGKQREFFKSLFQYMLNGT